MTDYKFKIFEKTGSKNSYTISFNGKSFSFGFNSGFYKKYEVEKYKKVILGYDEENKAVAFKFTNEENAKGAFTLVHGNNSGSVIAKSFIEDCKINNEEFFGRKNPIIIKNDDLGEVVVIDLAKN